MIEFSLVYKHKQAMQIFRMFALFEDDLTVIL